MTWLFVVVVLLVLVLVGYGYVTGLHTVRDDQVTLVTRKFGLSPAHERYPIRIHGSRGKQAAVLESGSRHWRPRWLFESTRADLVHVPPGSVGLVEAVMGELTPRGQLFAKHVECENFRDGIAFLAGGGQQGQQVDVLGNGRHPLNTWLFECTVVDQVEVPPDSVGLVLARAGSIPPGSQKLGAYIECDHFQDGPAFIANGGNQGAQLAVLPGGARYSINTWMFTVITVLNVEHRDHGFDIRKERLRHITLSDEDIGVVIVFEGAAPTDPDEPAPRVPGHDHFQAPWHFLANGGQRGIQSEVLPSGGKYAINPLFARVIEIPRREILLQWNDTSESEDRYDASLNPIRLMVEGSQIEVHLSQKMRIPPEAAPALVRQFGDEDDPDNARPAPVKRFVQRVIGDVVTSYFTGVTSQFSVEEFPIKLLRMQTEVQDRVAKALEVKGIRACGTTISKLDYQDDELPSRLRAAASARVNQLLLQQEVLNAQVKVQIDNVRSHAELARKRAEIEEMIDLFGIGFVEKERILDKLSKFSIPNTIITGGPVNPKNITDIILPQLSITSTVDSITDGPRTSVDRTEDGDRTDNEPRGTTT
jgi:hypothetical protein